jgi:hypothetical protein
MPILLISMSKNWLPRLRTFKAFFAARSLA